MLYHLTLISSNGKTGPIPVSTTSKDSCPDCPLHAACYAGSGPLALFWQKVTDGRAGVPIDIFAAQVSALPYLQLWRHDQAGDLPGRGNEIDVDSLLQIVNANRGKRGFTYTHKPVLNGEFAESNRAAIKHANQHGFTINLSGNNFANADELAILDIAPVVVALPTEYGRKVKKGDWDESLDEYRARTADLPKETPNGNLVAVCPATYLDTNCAKCQLCQRQNRKCIVGFPLHGTTKKRGAEIVSNGSAA